MSGMLLENIGNVLRMFCIDESDKLEAGMFSLLYGVSV